jgi:hypothetical protein
VEEVEAEDEEELLDLGGDGDRRRFSSSLGTGVTGSASTTGTEPSRWE